MRVIRPLALLVTLIVGFCHAQSGIAATEEIRVMKAPFEWSQVCYKIPPGMPACHDEAASARLGLLAVGGSRVFSVPVDMDPLWGPHVSRMTLGGYFVPPSAGTLQVTATFAAGAASQGSYICVGFQGFGNCSHDANVGPLQASQGFSISFSRNVTSQPIRVEAWLEKQYAGIGIAQVDRLTLVFSPAVVVQDP